VSYHHSEDQGWYDLFVGTFGSTYDLFTDRSLERRVDSEDSEYVRRAIREKNVTGSSMTIVLCGANTWKRRGIDWEIQMTLNKQHALLGIVLPYHQRNHQGKYVVPNRIADNLRSGFAYLDRWPQNVQQLSAAIDAARARANNTRLIANGRDAMQRSLS